jgi:hypothetical protein
MRRVSCASAAAGGSGGYEIVGFSLASALGSEVPYDLDDDEWADEIERIGKAIDGDDDAGVWQWFQAHFPKMMKLVPTRRRESFVAGVRRAYDDGKIS